MFFPKFGARASQCEILKLERTFEIYSRSGNMTSTSIAFFMVMGQSRKTGNSTSQIRICSPRAKLDCT